jgi:hypothetical protein
LLHKWPLTTFHDIYVLKNGKLFVFVESDSHGRNWTWQAHIVAFLVDANKNPNGGMAGGWRSVSRVAALKVFQQTNAKQ